jgi:tetratricopeptide (TPR) repeat protein
MLISVWYPAVGGGTPLRVGDYRALDQTQSTLEPISDQHRARAAGDLQGTLGFALGTSFSRQTVDGILQHEAGAVQGARELAGRHPLVLVGLEGGAGGAYGLAEHLASYGYVVVGVSPTSRLSTLQATNTLGAIDHQAHRLEVLYDVARTFANVDATRFAIIGKNSDGLAALLFQMRNMSADALITIDGWEAKQNGAELRASPFFDPLKLRVPYLTFQQDNAPAQQFAAGQEMFNALRYSERRQYVIRDLEHILLLEYGAALPFSNTDRLLAYDFLHSTVRIFLDAHVRTDTSALAVLRQTHVERGYPAWLLEEENHGQALTAMPTAEELEPIVMSGDIARVRALHEIAQRENPDRPLFSAQAMRVYAFRFWQRNQRDTAIALYELIAAAYPSSSHAHNNLGNAYRDVGRTAAALASFERALALIDADPEVEPGERAESANVIRRKIDQLRNQGTASEIPMS